MVGVSIIAELIASIVSVVVLHYLDKVMECPEHIERALAGEMTAPTTTVGAVFVAWLMTVAPPGINF